MSLVNLDSLPDDEFNIIYNGKKHDFDLSEILTNEAFQGCIEYYTKMEEEGREETSEDSKMFRESFSKIFRMRLTTLKALIIMRELKRHLEVTGYIEYMENLKKNAETPCSGNTSGSEKATSEALPEENEQNTSQLPIESKEKIA